MLYAIVWVHWNGNVKTFFREVRMGTVFWELEGMLLFLNFPTNSFARDIYFEFSTHFIVYCLELWSFVVDCSHLF